MRSRLSPAEVFGLTDLRARVPEVLLTFRGDRHTPKSRFDHTSLHVLRPALSVSLWLGRSRGDGRVVVSNLFNHTQTPVSDGWSVRKTQVRDFRGRALSYDSHNGTDFAVAIGTTVVAAAPGKVLRVANELNRGGLKVYLDHGQGLVTSSNHLGRALVQVGDVVARGQPIALSAYSGIDGLLAFPWSVPHVHYNTWLNGVPVDPFSVGNESSLWRTGNAPVVDDGRAQDAFVPTVWSERAVNDVIDACAHAFMRERLASIAALDVRAMATLAALNMYPTRFPLDFQGTPRVYDDVHERRPLLDLPIACATGVCFADV